MCISRHETIFRELYNPKVLDEQFPINSIKIREMRQIDYVRLE